MHRMCALIRLIVEVHMCKFIFYSLIWLNNNDNDN